MVSGKYTSKEDREIMETIFEEKKNALHHHTAYSDPVWDKLGSKLNRRPHSLYIHWEGVIRPRILMHQNGVDHLDFRPILVDYFIEKDILFRNETKCNWSEIVKDKRFKGTTANYLSIIYRNLVRKVKITNPGIEYDDITSELVRQYLDSRSKNRQNVKQHKSIIQDYLTIKNSF